MRSGVVIVLFVLALLCGSAMSIRAHKAKKTSQSSLAPEQLDLKERAPVMPDPVIDPVKTTADVETPQKSTADVKTGKSSGETAKGSKKLKDPATGRTPQQLQAAQAELRAKHAEARRLNLERVQQHMKVGPERKYSATKGPGNAIPADAPNRRRKLRVKEPLPDYALKAKLMLEAAEANTWPGEPTVQGCTPAECTDWCDACDGAITCENSCFLYSTCRNDCS